MNRGCLIFLLWLALAAALGMAVFVLLVRFGGAPIWVGWIAAAVVGWLLSPLGSVALEIWQEHR
jgi:hypothetical protein